MDCHIEEVYADGTRKRVETSPNGHPNHVYPSRGWAQSSAMQHQDSWIAAIASGRHPAETAPIAIVVVGEEDKKDYRRLTVQDVL
jgi:hypothetical protein